MLNFKFLKCVYLCFMVFVGLILIIKFRGKKFMNRKFVISLLFIILTFLLILGCDLSINNDRNKLDGVSHFKKKYMDNLNYQCLSKKESEAKNSQIKLDENNNKNHFYSSRVSNVSNYHDRTHISCEKND